MTWPPEYAHCSWSIVVNLHSGSTADKEISRESVYATSAAELAHLNKYVALLLQDVLPLHLKESVARAGAGLRRTLEPLPLPLIAANTHDLHQQAAR